MSPFLPTNLIFPIQGITSNWDFLPSPVSQWRKRKVVKKILTKARLRPRWEEVSPVSENANWVVYFLFSPNGEFTKAHEYSLSRLRDSGNKIYVVCGSPRVEAIPKRVHDFADALSWKAPDGYDFSAYTLALHQISRKSPGANVLVLNDSVYGPFVDVSLASIQTRWDLTGFTGSAEIENHVQSYAFILKAVTPERLRKLATVFMPVIALSTPQDVIDCQELRLARVASQSMSVGTYWFSDALNPTLCFPEELIRAGHPFLKKALLGKSKSFQDPARMIALLDEFKHPTSS